MGHYSLAQYPSWGIYKHAPTAFERQRRLLLRYIHIDIVIEKKSVDNKANANVEIDLDCYLNM